MLDQLADFDSFLEASLAKVREISKDIKDNIDIAVQSLQMGDIVTQLIGHSVHDVEKIAEIFYAFKQLVNNCEMNLALYEENQNKIIDMLSSLHVDDMSSHPVQQESVASGDIELF